MNRGAHPCSGRPVRIRHLDKLEKTLNHVESDAGEIPHHRNSSLPQSKAATVVVDVVVEVVIVVVVLPA